MKSCIYSLKIDGAQWAWVTPGIVELRTKIEGNIIESADIQISLQLAFMKVLQHLKLSNEQLLNYD